MILLDGLSTKNLCVAGLVIVQRKESKTDVKTCELFLVATFMRFNRFMNEG
jgi:hypothetical protein